VRKWEESVKSFLTPGVLFEELGFRYFGPVDGHDIDALIDTFEAVRDFKGPRLVHVITQKGKGFPPVSTARSGTRCRRATIRPPASSGQRRSRHGQPAYTAVFGKGLAELGERVDTSSVITAAMPSGTGTGPFGKAYPERFFDVGIAEGHAVTFAAGLATQGIRPVVAIYSTFLQRGYDNIIHDVAIQHLPVTFAMDRAGLVGEDGETHAGLYDIAYMLAVPGMTVTAPKQRHRDARPAQGGVEHDGPFCLRYPRDTSPDVPPAMSEIPPVPYGTWEVPRQGREFAILAVGTMVATALEAAAQLAEDGIDLTVVNCRYLKPYDEVTLNAILANHAQVLTLEEGTVINGFGAFMSATIGRLAPNVRVSVHGVPDRIVYAASRARQLAQCGLDVAGVVARVRALHESEAIAG
jgi:1-deoxy-D-xylulose-5-phosphate synthase